MDDEYYLDEFAGDWREERTQAAYHEADKRRKQKKGTDLQPIRGEIVRPSRLQGVTDDRLRRLAEVELFLQELKQHKADRASEWLDYLTRKRLDQLMALAQQLVPLWEDPNTHPLVRVAAEQAFDDYRRAWSNLIREPS